MLRTNEVRGQAVLELHSFRREMCCAGKQSCLSRSKQAWKIVVLSALKNKLHLDHLDRNYLQWIQSLINVASLVNLTTFLYYPIAFALPIWCAFLLNSVNRFLTESWTEKKKKRIIQLNGCLNRFAASALCQPFTKFSSEFNPSTEVLLAEIK